MIRTSGYRKSKGSQCEVCDKTTTLLVHHRDWNTENNSLSNLVTLCKSCHAYYHSVPSRKLKGGYSADHYLSGEAHPMAKLKKAQVIEIRNKYLTGNFTQEELAYEYGIARKQISNITLGKKWKSILDV